MSAMRMLLALGLLALLSGGCAAPAASPSPSPSPMIAVSGAPPPVPASVAAVPQGPPFRARLMQQYWAFSPGGAHYATHGELEILRDDPPAARVVLLPSWPQVPPHDMKVSPNIKVMGTPELAPNGGPAQKNVPGWVLLAVDVKSLQPLKAHDVLRYDVSWDQVRVPYLHDEGGGVHRLLSISGAGFPDHPRNQYVFAIPDNCTDIHLSDVQPVRTRKVPGWTIYEYDTSNLPHMVIHLAFAFGPAPTQPAPSAADIFRELPR